ncbi:MAG: hypothetical protein JKY53_14945 [Flavobacteriales bacterium]|nr:hypothetical protein [Flavobacteriales bacterium]
MAIAGLGGVSGVFITRNDANHDVIIGVVDKSKYLMLNTALRVPSFLALISVWYIWVKRDEYLLTLADRHKHLLILLFLFLMNMVTNFPLALARYWLGAMIIALVFCGLKKTNKTMSQWIVGFVVVLLVFFPITSEFRHMESITDVEKIELSGVVKHLYHGDYDAFQQVMNTVQAVEYNGLSYGRNFLVAPLFWVPRSIWTSKPYGTGQEVAEAFRYDFTNLSEPLWAEAYYAFGYFGVAFILFMYGFLSNRLDTLYQLESTGSLINIFVPFWCGFQLFFLRGDLLNGAAYSLPLIVIMVVVYRKKRV